MGSPASMLPASEQTCAGWSPNDPIWLEVAWLRRCMAWKNMVHEQRPPGDKTASRVPEKASSGNLKRVENKNKDR